MEAKKRGLERRATEVEQAMERSALLLREVEQELHAASLLGSELADRHAVVVAAIPPCERLHRAYSDLCGAEAAMCDRQRQLEHAQTRHDRLSAQLPSKAERDIARRRFHEATERKTRCEVMAQEAEQRYLRLTRLGGAALCDYCQQPLPPAHLEAARARLQSEWDEAKSQLARASEELHVAQAAVPADDEQEQRSPDELREAENRVIQLKAERRALQDARTEAQRCVRAAREDLPEPYRAQYQAHSDDSVEEAACRWAAEVETLVHEQRKLAGRMHDAGARLRQAHASMERLREKQKRESRGLHDVTDQLQSLVELTAQRRGEYAQLCRASAAARDALRVLLPAPLQEGDHEQLQALRREHDALEALDVAARYRKLQDARLNAAHLSGQLSSVREQMAKIPESARKPAAEIEGIKAEAEERQRTLDRERQAAAAELARLEEEFTRREALAADLKRTDREQCLWERLVILLGRHGLMRYLVEHAERAIVDFANEILDRLSAGQLFLELRTGEQDLEHAGASKALDLLARMATSDGELQEVGFLSGSQRFRVAVSLSLAIGQYATQARRPVQAVIIDEGFGCLDAVNCQVMIQELQNLRNYLERVLIVSHQEEFAAAFPDGYRSEIVDGTTRLTRFHQ